MTSTGRLISTAAGLFIASLVPAQAAQTVVEQRLAEIKPCSYLSVKRNVAGKTVTIGFDKLDAIELRRAVVNLADDHVSFTFEGYLSCSTSEGALLQGDAAVDLTATATMDLGTCTVRSISADSVNFSGSFGPLVASGWNLAGQPMVEREVTSMLVEACGKFTNTPQ